jgi:hypothetical protein
MLAARPLAAGEPALLVPASLRLSNSTALQIPVVRSIVGLGYAGWRAADGALASNNTGSDGLPEEEMAELRRLVDGMVTTAEVPLEASSGGAALGHPCRLHWRADGGGQLALVLLLHHEAFVARNSSYAPYLASLPTNFEGLPLLWEPAEGGDGSGGDGEEGGAENGGNGSEGGQRSGVWSGNPFGEGFDVEAAILAELAAAGGEGGAQSEEAAAAPGRASAPAPDGASPLAPAEATPTPNASPAPPAAPRLPDGVCVPERRGRRLWALAQEVPELAGALRTTGAATRQRIHMLIADVFCRFPRVYGRGHGCALYGVAHVEALQAQCRPRAAAALQTQCDAAAAEAAAAAAALAAAANVSATVGASGNHAGKTPPAPATPARNTTAMAAEASASAVGEPTAAGSAEATRPVDPACTPEGIAAGAVAACPASLFAEEAAALELEWDEAGVVTRMRWEAELAWAVAIETTRAFSPRFLGDGPTLIPLADFANHRRTAHTVRAITARPPGRAAAGSRPAGESRSAARGDSGSDGEDMVVSSAGGNLRDQGPENTPVAAVLHAATTLQADEELFTSYHDETPADCSYSLFLNYGWVPAEEPAEDCAVLQAGVVWDVSAGLTPLETARLAFARAQGLLGPHDFAWRPVIVTSAAATQLPAGLLAAGRLRALSRGDISRCEAAAAAATAREAARIANATRDDASCDLFGGPLSPSNEAAALQAIAAILSSHTEEYAAREAAWVRRGIMHRALLSPGLHNRYNSSISSPGNVSSGAESTTVAGAAAARAVAPSPAEGWAGSVEAESEPRACDLPSLLSGSPVEPLPAHAPVGSADPNVLNVILVHQAAVRALQHTEGLLQQRLAAAAMMQPPVSAAGTTAV